MRGAPGYSLLELLVVLAIAGLIAAVAVPAAATSLDRMALNADARLLMTQLRLLRVAALDRQEDIVLTASAGVVAASTGASFALSRGASVEVEGARFVIGAEGSAGGVLRVSRGGAALRIVAEPLTGRLRAEAAR